MNTVLIRKLTAAAMLALPLTAVSAGAFAQPSPTTPTDASNESGTVSKPGANRAATRTTRRSKTASPTTRHATPRASTQ